MLAMFLHGASHTTEQNSANSYVQKGIEYISSNYSYAITVEDIADYVGVSRSHLFRSFETVLGQSPKEYLTDFRMKQACYLLEHSSLSITAIANSQQLIFFQNVSQTKTNVPKRIPDTFPYFLTIKLTAVPVCFCLPGKHCPAKIFFIGELPVKQHAATDHSGGMLIRASRNRKPMFFRICDCFFII